MKNQSCYFVEHKTRKKKRAKADCTISLSKKLILFHFFLVPAIFFFFSFCIRSARQLLFTLFSFQNSMILSTRTVTQNNDIRKRNTLINWAWLNFFLWNSTRFCFFLHFFLFQFHSGIPYFILSSPFYSLLFALDVPSIFFISQHFFPVCFRLFSSFFPWTTLNPHCVDSFCPDNASRRISLQSSFFQSPHRFLVYTFFHRMLPIPLIMSTSTHATESFGTTIEKKMQNSWKTFFLPYTYTFTANNGKHNTTKRKYYRRKPHELTGILWFRPLRYPEFRQTMKGLEMWKDKNWKSKRLYSFVV